jgi:hypothetical protein
MTYIQALRTRVFTVSAVVAGCLAATVSAQQPRFNIMKPSTSGMPGEECRAMAFDPAGNLWVAGRMPFLGRERPRDAFR